MHGLSIESYYNKIMHAHGLLKMVFDGQYMRNACAQSKKLVRVIRKALMKVVILPYENTSSLRGKT